MSVKDYFLDFISYDTASDEESTTTPSTKKQKLLGAHLVDIMKDIGIADAFMDEYGYVYGTIPANKETKNTVGYIAHMDTYGGISGKNVKPRVIENYNGEDIRLNHSVVMTTKDFPSLLSHVGKTLIVTDGTTLLGGDDKAGIAEILAAAEEIIREDKPHGKIKIGFTPDEEIGRGADKFDVAGFGCNYAYTVDGGEPEEIAYENFNAASAKVIIGGQSVHTGSAKGKLVHSTKIAIELLGMLPENEAPEYTENYEGFFHLENIQGSTEETVMKFIIRDHDKALFDTKKKLMEDSVNFLQNKYPRSSIKLIMEDTYYNMLEVVKPHIEVVDNMVSAMKVHGIEAVPVAIRGGTDGARLSFMGLPCPNIGTGGYNCHGKYEYNVLEEMETMKDIIKTAMYNAD